MKSWPNVATKQLQPCKKVQQKKQRHCLQSKIFPPYLRQVAKIYVATSHNVVWLETIEISKQTTAFIWCFAQEVDWFFAQEVDWCLKDCDKQRLQTTVSINLWKIFAGHTGGWFDVRTASICTTDLWDSLKSFILNSLKFKVAPLPYNSVAGHLKVARNEVKNASFVQRSAHRDSRIWRPEFIEPAAERKRHARRQRPTFKSAYPDAQILPQCNISSNYPL